jgi:hypothetical protein
MAHASVSKLLGENADLKPLTTRLAHIKRLQRRYRTLAPERLADSSRVCAVDGTTVVICADNAAIAAALRHLAPRILAELRAKNPRDQELNSIRVEVQVKERTPKRAAVARAPLPRDKLAKVAASLGPSPLKETLERVARDDPAARKRSAD